MRTRGLHAIRAEHRWRLKSIGRVRKYKYVNGRVRSRMVYALKPCVVWPPP